MNSGPSSNGATSPGGPSEPLLRVEKLIVRYGQVQALHGLSLEVYPGEVVAIIGSNGAGKSTTMRAISGMIKSYSGRVLFQERDITRLASHEIVRLGLGHVPEGRQVFANQSVRDNLVLGSYAFARDKEGTRRILERELERFPVLAERQHQLAGTLSGGEQQMLAISRGLMSRPKMLLLDEPSMGLAPLLVKQVANTIQQLNQEGVTILLVEQMAAMALYVASRAYVIQNGMVCLEGPSASIAQNPDVVKAYLGGAH
jgi:branched-chain amino acid transport system ATP-binding protein